MTVPIQYTTKATSASALVRDIEARVADGDLEPGQRLPSIRRLAADVGLSPATVAAGLAELRRRGVVVSEARRGTRIGDGPPIGSQSRALAVPPGAIDVSHGNPDPRLLPDLVAAIAVTELPVRLYGEQAAIPELLDLARSQLLADAIPCEAVCVVSGALDGIERALQSHMRPGDRVAVEDPGYAAQYDLLRAQGLELEPVAVDDRGMLADQLDRALARGARAAIITPRGQNPTGAALDAARAGELRRALAAHPETLVIEDDHLGAVAGAALHSTIAGAERWAATRSVAKALGPDLRLAVLAGDPQTVARVQGRQQCGPGWVSHILQSLVLTLWRDRRVARTIARAESTYTDRRQGFIAALAAHGIAARGSSGLNVWVPVDDEARVVGSLMQRGWVVASGARYRLRSAPAVRVTTSSLKQPSAARLAADLADVLAPADRLRSA